MSRYVIERISNTDVDCWEVLDKDLFITKQLLCVATHENAKKIVNALRTVDALRSSEKGNEDVSTSLSV